MQGPIPSADSMIHIRGGLPRTGPISLPFEITPGWQFPGERSAGSEGRAGGHQPGQTAAGGKSHGAFLHRLQVVQNLGRGKTQSLY